MVSMLNEGTVLVKITEGFDIVLDVHSESDRYRYGRVSWSQMFSSSAHHEKRGAATHFLVGPTLSWPPLPGQTETLYAML